MVKTSMMGKWGHAQVRCDKREAIIQNDSLHTVVICLYTTVLLTLLS